MGQRVWHIDDITQIGQTLIVMAPSYEFAAGVAALCAALGGAVKLPALKRNEVDIYEKND